MAYPIQWLDATFSSRSKAEDLLRPDVESGLITQHDYELATAFLPGSHRYWGYGYGVMGSCAGAAYARYFRRPPMNLNRTILAATLCGFFGASYGQFRRAKAHFTFTNLLDDPVAFSAALENVNKRTGGVKPLGWTLQRAREVARKEEMHGNAARPSDDPWATDPAEQFTQASTQTSQPLLPSPGASPQPQPKSRWEEIRAANARNAGQTSSWDALRQSHERKRIPTGDRAEAGPGGDGRAQEQAQFDALLEAERRIGGGSISV